MPLYEICENDSVVHEQDATKTGQIMSQLCFLIWFAKNRRYELSEKFFFPSMLSISSFHLFLRHLLELWLPQLCQPLRMARTSATWHQCLHGPFHSEKDSQSSSWIVGASFNSKFQWHILMNGGRANNAKILRAKNSWVSTENDFTQRTFFIWASRPTPAYQTSVAKQILNWIFSYQIVQTKIV